MYYSNHCIKTQMLPTKRLPHEPIALTSKFAYWLLYDRQTWISFSGMTVKGYSKRLVVCHVDSKSNKIAPSAFSPISLCQDFTQRICTLNSFSSIRSTNARRPNNILRLFRTHWPYAWPIIIQSIMPHGRLYDDKPLPGRPLDLHEDKGIAGNLTDYVF